MSEDIYVVILDKSLDFCRLFRDGSENMPTGTVLWSGNGLRRGYDAMIRLNKERKPIEPYYACSLINAKGRVIYKIFKGNPSEGWEIQSTHYNYQMALSALRNFIFERDKEIRNIMERVGITTKKLPNFTPTDLKYINWLKEEGKLQA